MKLIIIAFVVIAVFLFFGYLFFSNRNVGDEKLMKAKLSKMQYVIPVLNLKCGGCAKTVKDSLMKIDGVKEVVVYPPDNAVGINGTKKLDLSKVKKVLDKAGYPEAGHNNLGKVARSYASCAIGKITK